MIEVAELGALVEGADRIGRQRAETHPRDIQDRRTARGRALGAADGDPKISGIRDVNEPGRVADELIAILI